MDDSDLNQFLQMVWTKVPYSHIYTYGVYHHSAFTMLLMFGQSAQYGWRKIAGTENYTHTYLHGNPLDTCTCLGSYHPDGRAISHHSLSSSSSSSISKEPTNDYDNDHSNSSTLSSSNESLSDASSSSSSSSFADEQSNSSSSSSSASATNSSKEMDHLSYASTSASE
ncbi:hypothetical protein P691DRAFT_765349 [Macrolepiota fuliginosa MF-IS2]|uniref:Uncharacterized protein n=1 Tax=Macrolepiota fuliginosa MF-IS2 TaxID=1400762 RepID=A0A9P5X2R5_9AGAR|nr:hypothetical protein P691DRAFT_765349 [Macrolepiota fuliginosa MF-IS2]